MSDVVVTEKLSDRVLQVTINRPNRRNALNGDVLRDLAAAFEAAKIDESVGAIVLTGAGEKAFCAGGDLSPGGAFGGGMLGMHYDRALFVELFSCMRNLGKPIIARVQGHCLAGGLGVMLACDMVISSDNATFGTPEIKVGLFPMMIMALIFRNVGRKKGMELLLTGDRISAERAERMGLINRVVSREELDGAVLELANKVGGFSPAILKLGRDAFYTMEDMPYEQALVYLQSQLTLNTLAEDAAEGIAAFFGKRSPKWKGK